MWSHLLATVLLECVQQTAGIGQPHGDSLQVVAVTLAGGKTHMCTNNQHNTGMMDTCKFGWLVS